jgi:putative membrane protein
MEPLANLGLNVAAVVIYAFLGMILIGVGLWVVDRLTPGTMWKEIIEEHNTALATVMAAVLVAFSIVIAAAIVG